MSPNYYLSYGGLLPKALTDPDGLVKFKEFLAKISEKFEIENEMITTLLWQIGNVSDVNSLGSALLMWKEESDLAIDDFETVFKAVNKALYTLIPRGLHYIKVQITPDENTIEVNFLNPATTDSTTPSDAESSDDDTAEVLKDETGKGMELTDDDVDESYPMNETDISEATDKAVPKELKDKVNVTFSQIAQGRTEIQELDENPVSNAPKDADDTWLTPKGKHVTSVIQLDDSPTEDHTQGQNRFAGFTQVDDEQDASLHDEFAGSTLMEQSIETVSDNDSPTKETKSEKDKLLDQKDFRFRDKGWQHINRIVGKGDTDKLSVEDLAYYINRGPHSLKQATSGQLASFDSKIHTKTRDAETNFTSITNAIVKDATKRLNIEDGMVFNKISTNRTQLENSITTAKNHVAK